jgi:hypothetical protein
MVTVGDFTGIKGQTLALAIESTREARAELRAEGIY